jgi:hypothetical protein
MKYNLIALACAILLAAGLSLTVTAGPTEPDTDSDGVVDQHDNCPTQANAAQQDADLDGYGQICDANYDNIGKVTATDFATFKASYGLKSGAPGYDDQTNHDCIGKVTATDFATFKSMYGLKQGPGADCATGAKGVCSGSGC